MSTETQDPQRFGHVAVLMGGWSGERDVSLRSGQAVLEALQASGVNAHAVDANKATLITDLLSGNFDRVFNILHGTGGEDGVVQGALDLLGLPYTGSGVMASALSMDKLRSKQVLESAGIPTPAYQVLERGFDAEYVVANLGLPLMVKPALEGSSLGMSKVEQVEDLLAAFELAAEYNGEVLAERWIGAAEYTVAVLAHTPLPVVGLQTPRVFYDYQAKYESDDTRYLCPCGLPVEEERRLQRLAMSAFRALGASGWGRVDIMCSEDGNPWVIELNTVPGMTDHSLVPMAANAAGMSFAELVLAILSQTLTAGTRR